MWSQKSCRNSRVIHTTRYVIWNNGGRKVTMSRISWNCDDLEKKCDDLDQIWIGKVVDVSTSYISRCEDQHKFNQSRSIRWSAWSEHKENIISYVVGHINNILPHSHHIINNNKAPLERNYYCDEQRVWWNRFNSVMVGDTLRHRITVNVKLWLRKIVLVSRIQFHLKKFHQFRLHRS